MLASPGERAACPNLTRRAAFFLRCDHRSLAVGHPFYIVVALFVLAGSPLTANWFIFVVTR
jgi:hypothetical protein